MIKKILFVLCILQVTACAELQNIAGTVLSDTPLSNTEIAGGLKQALNIGITEGAAKLSATDGYFKSAYKILLPADVQKVTSKLSGVPGFNNLENELLKLVNRGAEDAAKKAAPIFKDAITTMSFDDAMNILMGSDNSATQYLNTKTSNPLYSAFKPEIKGSLDRVNATQMWNKAITTYNKIPFVNKLNPDLDDYVTKQALKGLFSMVEKKEKGIRNDVGQRTTDLLKKVFAKQDNK